MKTEVRIDEAALESTIALCAKEMEESQKKYSPSVCSLLLRFILFDLRLYFLFAILGLIATLILSYLQQQHVLLFLGIYGALLGISSIYSYGRTRYYHCEELMTPLYLHPGRVLLIQNAGIAAVNLIIFILFYGISCFFQQAQIDQMMIVALLPMFLLQILLLLILPRIRHIYSAFVLSLLFYGGYYLIYRFLQPIITAPGIYLFLGLVLGIYGYCILHMLHHIQTQKGGYYGTNYQTCG